MGFCQDEPLRPCVPAESSGRSRLLCPRQGSFCLCLAPVNPDVKGWGDDREHRDSMCPSGKCADRTPSLLPSGQPPCPLRMGTSLGRAVQRPDLCLGPGRLVPCPVCNLSRLLGVSLIILELYHRTGNLVFCFCSLFWGHTQQCSGLPLHPGITCGLA